MAFLTLGIYIPVYWTPSKSLKKTTEAVAQKCSVKKVFLEISQNSQENLCQSPFFNKVTGLRPATLLKETLAQVFSCEFCENSKNIFLHKTSLVAASETSCSQKIVFTIFLKKIILPMSNIYMYNVFNQFKCRNLGDYHDLTLSCIML